MNKKLFFLLFHGLGKVTIRIYVVRWPNADSIRYNNVHNFLNVFDYDGLGSNESSFWLAGGLVLSGFSTRLLHFVSF